jgi:protein-S-isoprenylcysteine O-methyltransferase Ste14
VIFDVAAVLVIVAFMAVGFFAMASDLGYPAAMLIVGVTLLVIAAAVRLGS